MKTGTVGLLLALLALPVGAAPEPKTLDGFLDERIVLNAKYRDDYVKEAEDATFGKVLAPLEKEIGDEWVAYLKFVRGSKDRKLKIHVLRLELLDELRGRYWDLDYAEGFLERAKLRSEIEGWKKKMAALMKLAEEDAPPAPAAEGANIPEEIRKD